MAVDRPTFRDLPSLPINIHLLANTLRTLEWAGPGDSCLVCGSSFGAGHAPGCPIGRVLRIDMGPDGLDGAVCDAVFQVATQRGPLLAALASIAAEIESAAETAVKVEGLLPRQ